MAVGVQETLQLSSKVLLDKIDKLRELGVAEYVALPQLVVVGDQSSGKSSVLDGFTELPFPRDSGLCTRFATQITFRRTPQTNITVSIIPSPKLPSVQAEKLKSYRKDELKSLDGKEFLNILKEVCKLMGIPGPGESLETGQSTFSSNVLKIEICGPKCDNLSMIDIPGIFRTPTPNVTTMADMAVVREMVTRYIQDKRTIILAVIPAPTDIATQEILTMAEEVDPEGTRTLGVLTKPDLVDKGGEQSVIDLVEGKRKQLRLGYCIVRNLGQKELNDGSTDRHQKEEAFFNTSPWSSLDKDRVGIPALKLRLKELLHDITRQEFPKVKQQIDQRLAECKRNLAALGLERETKEQQHIYLQKIAIEFQKITDFALDTYYGHNDVFDKIPELRLPTLIVDRNDVFSDDVVNKGHTVKFDKEEEEDDDEKLEKEFMVPEKEFTKLVVGAKKIEERGQCTRVFYESNYAELSSILPEPWDMPESEDAKMSAWIEGEYRKSRGHGLGAIGPSILPTLWKSQSTNWEGLTLDYMSDVIFLVHNFIQKLLAHVCPDKQTLVRIQDCLEDLLLEKYKKALDHVSFIVFVERFGTPQTMNHYFNENLQKLRQKRAKLNIEELSWQQTDPVTQRPCKVVKVDNVTKGAQNVGNLEHTVNDLSDILRSYYKVARKRFVDTVCMQGCDYHLLNGDDSPLRTFSPTFVSSLGAEKLDEIAGEDMTSRRTRKTLKIEIEALEQAKKLLRA